MILAQFKGKFLSGRKRLNVNRVPEAVAFVYFNVFGIARGRENFVLEDVVGGLVIYRRGFPNIEQMKTAITLKEYRLL